MSIGYTDLFYQAITVVLLVSLPILAAITVVGIVVAAFQSATSIQDRGSLFAIKLVALLILIYLAGAAFIGRVVNFAILSWGP